MATTTLSLEHRAPLSQKFTQKDEKIDEDVECIILTAALALELISIIIFKTSGGSLSLVGCQALIFGPMTLGVTAIAVAYGLFSGLKPRCSR